MEKFQLEKGATVIDSPKFLEYNRFEIWPRAPIYPVWTLYLNFRMQSDQITFAFTHQVPRNPERSRKQASIPNIMHGISLSYI